MINLTQIKARLDAATPGEWKTNGAMIYSQITGRKYGTYVASASETINGAITQQASADADLIAHAPADLRALDGKAGK